MSTSNNSNGNGNGNGNGNNSNKRKAPPAKGVDTLLTIRGRPLRPGESVRFQLLKGPSVQESGDPVDHSAPVEQFPLVAKFGESVKRPIFTQDPWKSGRLYQQEVPKPVDDSDQEEDDAPQSQQKKKKRWRYSDGVAPRQWIMQENVDFLQSMVDRKEASDSMTAHNGTIHSSHISSRYEGTAEHNPSRYCLIRLHPSTTSPQDASLQVCLLPSHANSHIHFAQPAARKTYSLTEAENVISDQRMGLVKSLHHMQPKGGNNNNNNNNNGDGDNKEGENTISEAPRPNILALRRKVAQSSKGRLLNKLSQKSKTASANNEEEDGDDVMGDVAFRHRKGGGAARKELLQTVGDGVTVSDEGVLGGANDAMFGGRQRFAQLAADAKAGDKTEGKKDDGVDADTEIGNPAQEQDKERGADGAAMDDDFYQRDVKAEYDELDYDASEQFDDDDVDLGEGEVVVENSGYGGDNDNELDEELDDDEVEEGAQGAVGLASLAGFKALLAKARGEVPPEPTEATTAQTNDRNNSNSREKKSVDHMSKILEAAEKSRLSAERKQQHRKQQDGGAAPMDVDEPNAPAPEQPAAAPTAPAVKEAMVDANGLRIITLDTVRSEIWLHHGSIPTKRLMKIFDVKKKSAQERRDQFREIVKELCIMKNDPVTGPMLVLKQHYSRR